MDDQSETKKVAQEKREWKRKARLQMECCQKEKENTKMKYFKCEDRKQLSQESNSGPQPPQATILPLSHHHSHKLQN